jgi:hypothetical protein
MVTEWNVFNTAVNLCGNLPQGSFTSSDQAVFIVTGKLRPFWDE